MHGRACPLRHLSACVVLDALVEKPSGHFSSWICKKLIWFGDVATDAETSQYLHQACHHPAGSTAEGSCRTLSLVLESLMTLCCGVQNANQPACIGELVACP